MDVDDPSELRSSLIPVEDFSLEDREMANADMDLRGGQESRDQLQNLGVALCSVVEPRGVDENYSLPIESELIRELDLGRARLQAHSDPQIRAACAVDKLEPAG